MNVLSLRINAVKSDERVLRNSKDLLKIEVDDDSLGWLENGLMNQALYLSLPFKNLKNNSS